MFKSQPRLARRGKGSTALPGRVFKISIIKDICLETPSLKGLNSSIAMGANPWTKSLDYTRNPGWGSTWTYISYTRMHKIQNAKYNLNDTPGMEAIKKNQKVLTPSNNHVSSSTPEELGKTYIFPNPAFPCVENNLQHFPGLVQLTP